MEALRFKTIFFNEVTTQVEVSFKLIAKLTTKAIYICFITTIAAGS